MFVLTLTFLESSAKRLPQRRQQPPQPTTTDVLPKPKTIIQIVQCQCKSVCRRQICSCRRNQLACVELCEGTEMCDNDEYSCSHYAFLNCIFIP